MGRNKPMHTFAIIHLHVVFATWNRYPFLDSTIRPDLHAYVASTARSLGITNVSIGGVEDHLHLLGRFDPARAVSDQIGQLKKSSGDWLRARLPKFRWQRGCGAFSVSPNRVEVVQRYVMRQEEHHRVRTFREELEELFRELGASVDDLGLF